MLQFHVILNGDGAWPDLEVIAALGKLIEYQSDISVAVLEGGMESGKPSVSFRFDLPDGRVLIAQTSLRLFLQVADILSAKYPDGYY